MVETYREAALQCPACSTALDTRVLHDAEVDVCPRCKGIWVDWFDGELHEVALQASPMSIPSTVIAELKTANCPHCKRSIDLQPYGPGGPALWRCGECAGAFVPRASFEALTEMMPPEDVPPSQHDEPKSAFDKLRAILHRLLSGSAVPPAPQESTEE